MNDFLKLEQPPGERNNIPPDENAPPKKIKPGDVGYKPFSQEENTQRLAKAKTARKKEGKEVAAELSAVLDEARNPEATKIDEKVMLKKEDKKTPKTEQEAIKAKEKPAFLELMSTFQQNNKLPIEVDGKAHIFEYKGLSKDGKVLGAKEVEKDILGKLDKGGDVLSNVDFRFQATIINKNNENQKLDIDYRVSLHQIMRDGLEATLSSLLELSYAAAATYDTNNKKAIAEGEKAATSEAPKKPIKTTIENLREQLAAKNIQTSGAETAENTWGILLTDALHQQKQVAVTLVGSVFNLKTQQQQAGDKSVHEVNEIKTQNPTEVVQYIEEAA